MTSETFHTLSPPFLGVKNLAKTQIYLVVEPTHLKNMLVKLENLPQDFGVKIQKIFELPPPRNSKNPGLALRPKQLISNILSDQLPEPFQLLEGVFFCRWGCGLLEATTAPLVGDSTGKPETSNGSISYKTHENHTHIYIYIEVHIQNVSRRGLEKEKGKCI